MSESPGNPTRPCRSASFTHALTMGSWVPALVDSAPPQGPSPPGTLSSQGIAWPWQGTFATKNPDSLLCVLGQNCHVSLPRKAELLREVVGLSTVRPLRLGRSLASGKRAVSGRKGNCGAGGQQALLLLYIVFRSENCSVHLL